MRGPADAALTGGARRDWVSTPGVTDLWVELTPPAWESGGTGTRSEHATGQAWTPRPAPDQRGLAETEAVRATLP